MNGKKTIVILSDYDIDNLKNYEYLIKEAAQANHIALDKLIVAQTIVKHGEQIDMKLIEDCIQKSIDLIRLARDQNNLLINYLAED